MSFTLQQRLAQLPGMGLADIGPAFQADVYASRNVPSGAPSDWAALCEACLRGRGIIYYKSRPGDCGSANVSSTAIKQQIVGAVGAGGTQAIAATGALAGAALAGATFGISVAVGVIADIFTHHTEAVATEQQTLCSIANIVNPTIAAIDSAVKDGSISPTQGVTFMNSLAQKAISGMQGIYKVCNAACDYIAVMKAHIDFAQSYYDAVAPPGFVNYQNPGGSPSAFGSLPGGVPATLQNPAADPPIRSTAVISGTYSRPGSLALGVSGTYSVPPVSVQSYQTPTGQSGKLDESIPVIGASWGLILLALLSLVLLVAVL